MLKGLETELGRLGVRLRVVEARARVRDRLRREGIEELIDRRVSVADVVEEWTAERAAGAGAAGQSPPSGPGAPGGSADTRRE